MARHSIKMIALLTAFGLTSAVMTVQAAERIALFPNWLAWAFYQRRQWRAGSGKSAGH